LVQPPANVGSTACPSKWVDLGSGLTHDVRDLRKVGQENVGTRGSLFEVLRRCHQRSLVAGEKGSLETHFLGGSNVVGNAVPDVQDLVRFDLLGLETTGHLLEKALRGTFTLDGMGPDLKRFGNEVVKSRRHAIPLESSLQLRGGKALPVG